MRDILFRGKRKDNGEWDYGDLIQLFGGQEYIIDNKFGACIDDKGNFINTEAPFVCKVIPETVGQYTGLKDKNGKRIFEGDIFKFPDEVWESCYTSCGTEYNSQEVENYGVVGFDGYSAKYDFVKYKYNENSVKADLHENYDIEFADFISELEVIGNIYDNPELIGK